MENYFEYIENISIKDKDLLPTIKFNNNKDEYSVSKYFDTLSNNEMKELDNIFEYANKLNESNKYEIIDKDIWLKYKIYKNLTINTLNETIKKNNYKDDDKIISINYGNNGKYKQLEFNDNTYNHDTKRNKLFTTYSDENPNYDNMPLLFMHKAGYYNTNKELLYIVLNCIFSSNQNFYIKKCNLCKKYYLTNKINKNYCERPRIVFDKTTNCLNSLNVFHKSKEYIKVRRLKDNYLSKYYKNNDSDSIKIINEFMAKYNHIIDNCKSKRNITIEDEKEIKSLMNY